MIKLKFFLNQIRQKKQKESLGLGLRPGDSHYRAYVGPPEDYDLVSAMTFNLLTTMGLRQHHTVLDIGCGSLRIGRLLIPYLNNGNYSGVEPNEWLVQDGIQREVGQDQINIKQPKFYFTDSLRNLPLDTRFDFAVAQSIFSHCGPDFVERWLDEISQHFTDSSCLIASFLVGEQDSQVMGWIYPGIVPYKVETMHLFAQKAGLKFLLLDWNHPRLQWGLFYKSNFDTTWFQNGKLTWNMFLEHTLSKQK